MDNTVLPTPYGIALLSSAIVLMCHLKQVELKSIIYFGFLLEIVYYKRPKCGHIKSLISLKNIFGDSTVLFNVFLSP